MSEPSNEIVNKQNGLSLSEALEYNTVYIITNRILIFINVIFYVLFLFYRHLTQNLESHPWKNFPVWKAYSMKY